MGGGGIFLVVNFKNVFFLLLVCLMLPDPAHKIVDMRSNTDVIHVQLMFAI